MIDFSTIVDFIMRNVCFFYSDSSSAAAVLKKNKNDSMFFLLVFNFCKDGIIIYSDCVIVTVY